MPLMSIRDASLFVEVVGDGYPLLLMHGGPGADHWTMQTFRRCADRYTVILYDHRSTVVRVGASVSTMTWDNLIADADALRETLGFERWSVLGHSFGGHVALEYALRYPDHLSHLVLLDTGGDSWWSLVNASDELRRRGYARRQRIWPAGSSMDGLSRGNSFSICSDWEARTTRIPASAS